MCTFLYPFVTLSVCPWRWGEGYGHPVQRKGSGGRCMVTLSGERGVWSPCLAREEHGHTLSGGGAGSSYGKVPFPLLPHPLSCKPPSYYVCGRSFCRSNMFPKKNWNISWKLGNLATKPNSIHQYLRFSKFTNGHTCALWLLFWISYFVDFPRVQYRSLSSKQRKWLSISSLWNIL